MTETINYYILLDLIVLGIYISTTYNRDSSTIK
jgi:hypothetical protein